MSQDKTFDMVFRVWVGKNVVRVFGNKKGDAATYSSEYDFRIWPWTDVKAKIERIKGKMWYECEICNNESTGE